MIGKILKKILCRIMGHKLVPNPKEMWKGSKIDPEKAWFCKRCKELVPGVVVSFQFEDGKLKNIKTKNMKVEESMENSIWKKPLFKVRVRKNVFCKPSLISLLLVIIFAIDAILFSDFIVLRIISIALLFLAVWSTLVRETRRGPLFLDVK